MTARATTSASMKSNGYRFDPFAVSGPLSLHDVSIATNRKRSAEAILCDRFLVPQAPTSFRYSVLACSQSLGVCRPRSIWTNLQRCASSPAVERNAKPRRFVQPLRVGYPPKSHRSLQLPQIGARSGHAHLIGSESTVLRLCASHGNVCSLLA
jgi:hypothetical protein